jgi:6-pyruvoyltetrahydropterin/6-carboxytetrahydropterin synthase
MLSKHPEKCRFPHGHTRRIEVVVSAQKLNKNEMVVDFKALKNAVEPFVEMFDHSMAINSNDPLLP